MIIDGDPQVRNSKASFGTWRMIVSEDDNVIFQRYEGRLWVTKQTVVG